MLTPVVRLTRPTLARSLACALTGAMLAGAAMAEVSLGTAEQLMRATGSWSRLGEVSVVAQSAMLAAVQTDPARAEGARRADILPLSLALQRAFAPERLRQSALPELARLADREDLARTQAWFVTDLGHRVTDVEAKPQDRTGDVSLRATDMRTRWSSLPAERRQVLDQIEQASGAAALQADILIHILQAVHRGTPAFMAKAARVSPAALKARLESQRQELQQGMAFADGPLLALRYAEFSDAQLKAYLAQLQSPEGVRVRQWQAQAMAHALQAAIEETDRQLQSPTSPAPIGVPRVVTPTAPVAR